VGDSFASTLNINLSSGILFNFASDLSFNSSKFVLRGISISNIRGTNNLDSVAFDAETNTTDNQVGQNAFQDVKLNGLVLSNDDGDAANAYQAAGLGCSDSLCLVGMTNVTLLNSVLYNEAACHTSTGTAAVILSRIADVTFVNNILFGVPETDSPDEAGIDLESSESNVNLYANLLGGNAGAGVEILNIHHIDHSTKIEIDDNTFVNNARSFNPEAASIWEDGAGGGFATPSATIQNNLYSESSGIFFGGNNIGSITLSNNLSTSSPPNYAAEQFSSVQGNNDWRYLFQSSDATWTDLPAYSPTDHNGAWEASPEQFVSAFDLSPAGCAAGACDTGGVARVWVVPHSGIISVRGRVLKSDARGTALSMRWLILYRGAASPRFGLPRAGSNWWKPPTRRAMQPMWMASRLLLET
jgi:hypothetical protein